MSLLADGVTILCVLAGLVFFAAGTVGLLRFPDTASRLHALTKADHLGLGLVVLGLLPQMDSLAGILRLLAFWALVLLASAATGPMIARLLRRQGGIT
ncbi:monovalent cation/H(+) antiporter subunit G [Roseomonas sp. HJA6]|uniref:Monovalent cation/H(+) antiporter subunit G n=1 Tax=Roseomonas alba TaxID=2846776 RepID=A0ABS7A8Y2_9PROT|nr:monovalent cation/H(+) antiporter subunit G [Neoroseomonas alba]MBW6398192.1 monovalent cation/H(+) antiporter subunit G [Neoroseomonas alba]